MSSGDLGQPAWYRRLSPTARAAWEDLQALESARLDLERDLGVAVRRARKAGVSWWSVGIALGVTGEAARRRYGGSS